MDKIAMIMSLSALVFSSTFDLKYGGSKIEIGYDAAQTYDGGFIVAGLTNSAGTEIDDYDGYLIKTDTNGILEWEETLPGEGEDYFIKVKQTSDGGFIVLGRNDFRILTESTVCNPWLVKYDDTGKLKWENTYEDLNVDLNISDFIITDDGGFLILGSKKTAISTVVIDSYCLHCIIGQDRKKMLYEIRRVLKPKGLFAGITMSNTIPDDIRQFFNEKREMIKNGIAGRYIGRAEEILEEFIQARFEIIEHSVEVIKNEADDLKYICRK